MRRFRYCGRAAGGALVLAAILSLEACASLGLREVIRPPRFEAASDRDARVNLVGPTLNNPYGAARIRLYARVENPNPFGLTLATLAGTLFLQGSEAATVDLPLGLPMLAGQDTVIPLDLTVGLDDLPNLAETLRGALGGGSLGYRMDGTVGVDAGALGTPTFGPMTLLDGRVRVY